VGPFQFIFRLLSDENKDNFEQLLNIPDVRNSYLTNISAGRHLYAILLGDYIRVYCCNRAYLNNSIFKHRIIEKKKKQHYVYNKDQYNFLYHGATAPVSQGLLIIEDS
jgi:hypothetical protein